jgi:hypothetical protein
MYTGASKEENLEEKVMHKSGVGSMTSLDLKAHLVLGLPLCTSVLPFKPLGIIKEISSK